MEAPPEFLDAIKRGDVAKVRDLIRATPGLANARTKRGLSPVLVAMYSGQKVVAATLIAGGADLDVHDASAVGRLDRVRDLVSRDPALVNARSADGFPPLGLAAYLGHRDVVEFLLSRGAEVDLTAPETGFTALTGAVSERHADVVDLLLAHGADPNHVYEGTLTPLVVAASHGDVRIVRTLLERGADPNRGAHGGKSALDLAGEKGHREVVELLRTHGAMAGGPPAPDGGTASGPDLRVLTERLRKAFNAHDLEGLVALVDPDYESEQPAHPERGFRGREQIRKNWASIFSRVPDFRADVLRGAVDGDTVWTEWRWHGMRADGSKFDLRGVTLFRVWNGRIVSGRLYMEPVSQPKKEGPYGEAP